MCISDSDTRGTEEGKPDSEAALKELTVALPEYEVACVNYSTAARLILKM